MVAEILVFAYVHNAPTFFAKFLYSSCCKSSIVVFVEFKVFRYFGIFEVIADSRSSEDYDILSQLVVRWFDVCFARNHHLEGVLTFGKTAECIGKGDGLFFLCSKFQGLFGCLCIVEIKGCLGCACLNAIALGCQNHILARYLWHIFQWSAQFSYLEIDICCVDCFKCDVIDGKPVLVGI